MRRISMTALVATCVLGAGSALGQGGDLSGVTMRVLDDLSGVDAVVLELDANDAEGEADNEAARRDGEGRGAERRGERPSAEPVEAQPRDLSRERDDLHEPNSDERSEGHLEDRDVERPAAAQPPA